MAKREENSATTFANRKKTAGTDPACILQNVARVPQTSPSWQLLNERLQKTPPHADVNVRRSGLTDLPKVSDVIGCKAGMRPGLGKPVFVTLLEKLGFPP